MSFHKEVLRFTKYNLYNCVLRKSFVYHTFPYVLKATEALTTPDVSFFYVPIGPVLTPFPMSCSVRDRKWKFSSATSASEAVSLLNKQGISVDVRV